MEGGKKLKKRGRKPKNSITVNDNPIFCDNSDNIIIKLNKLPENIDTFESIHNDEHCEYKEYISSNISKFCWNCCHEPNNEFIGFPIKYIGQ